MKKVISFLLAATMALSLAACGQFWKRRLRRCYHH